MKRDYSLYIKDSLDCIERIEDFIGDMNFDQFLEDDKTSSTVFILGLTTRLSGMS